MTIEEHQENSELRMLTGNHAMVYTVYFVNKNVKLYHSSLKMALEFVRTFLKSEGRVLMQMCGCTRRYTICIITGHESWGDCVFSCIIIPLDLWRETLKVIVFCNPGSPRRMDVGYNTRRLIDSCQQRHKYLGHH